MTHLEGEFAQFAARLYDLQLPPALENELTHL
jgi:hypothetical protein